MPVNDEIILKGVAASPGIAIGRIFLLEDDDYFLLQKNIPTSEIGAELERLNVAVEKTRTELKATYGKINDVLGENYAKIADVHLLILDDPMMNKDVVSMVNEGVNAEYAVFKVIEKIVKSFESIEDEYFRERKQDIQDVGRKIIANLLGKQKKTLANLSEDSIVVARNLTPADTVAIRERLVIGFATDIGGKTSHTAIVAQGLEIPAVVGLKNISSQVRSGNIIIIDGNRGYAILNPSEETVLKYKKQYDQQSKKNKALLKIKDLPAETLDAHKVALFSNIENADELQSVLNNGATGIGLYRTEFMYFNRSDMPTEEEHFENYVKVVKEMGDYPTIIRTIDLGGDKMSRLGILNVGTEANPFMGLRAIRLCLKYPEMFIAQLKGILRASAYGKIKLMYPMISGVEELKAANRILARIMTEFKAKKIKFDENIEIGAMIEIPSAAMITDVIAREVDFISIGTNDLIQYSLAVDRINENVANLYDPLHPAVLRLIKLIIDEGHKAGIEVAMCGEMAGDPYYTPLLLGFGLDEFSVSSAQIPKIKKVIRSVSFEEVKRIASEILKSGDRDAIAKIMAKIKLS
ncbi:MAG: phosphoenolpyruvate--protein phosphotransferase [Endomicrobia bacterium]|nr:phosphoenolpyruvate--protein phosphotransferase [Endomicrobiia bacterium]MCL2507237.1 phosphoenolpyruvate--protein phosphotransferase [Endomicrobiia bacterium]